MFRRAGFSYVARRAPAAITATTGVCPFLSSTTNPFSSPLSFSIRWNTTSSTPAAAAVDPSTSSTSPTKKKKKILKKVTKQKTTTPSTEEEKVKQEVRAMDEGEALRRELRGISSTPATPSASPSTSKKTPMVKGFKIEEVAPLCSPADALFARRLPAGGCQFFAWPGTPLEIASSAIVGMPDTIRTVHAVFGRRHTPIDVVLDVDCPVPQEHWSMSKIRPYQVKVLEDVCVVLQEEIEKIGEEIETQVILNSPNLKKASFHIHTKLKDVAFADYESLAGFLSRFQQRIPTVDLQIYRTNGMLRMYSSMKENRTSAIVVFEDRKWNIGFKDGVVSPEAAALHSVCVRAPGTYSRLLTFDPPMTKTYTPPSSASRTSDLSKEAYEEGDVQEVFKPVPVPLPLTKQEAIDNASRWLSMATEFEVMEWRQWIGLGLVAFRVAHHFRDANLERPAMDVMLNAWIEASKHCSAKFKHGDCEQKWATFDADKLKKGGDADWWLAYQRLGRLQKAAEENLAREEERVSKTKGKKK